MSLLRSRQPGGGSGRNATIPGGIVHLDMNFTDNEQNKRERKSFAQRLLQLKIIIPFAILVCFFIVKRDEKELDPSIESNNPEPPAFAPMGKIVYGAKSKGEDTAKLVANAIKSGFRHIATGGFHFEYNEAGVGAGWKESGVSRSEIYLQTLFLANSVQGYAAQNCLLDDGSCPPSPDLSIEDQVHLSIKSSLNNLQTDYIDAVLIHNFRAKLQPYEETVAAWKVLETYVDRGVIRDLGIVSVHDKKYITDLYHEARIKPSIIQNRFHSNRGYDTELRPFFRHLGMANQLFWILTGSAGGKVRNNKIVNQIATKNGVSPQVLLYSFTMQIGGTPLIGTKTLSHMKEDVDSLLQRNLIWDDSDFIAMASVISKDLVQNKIKDTVA